MFRIGFMIKILVALSFVVLSFSLYGQDTIISTQDSVLLRNFWQDFTKAIKNKDKAKLSNLCEFPFYCRPCLDYVSLKDTIPATVQVSKELYEQGLFKFFFDEPLRKEIAQNEKFDLRLFRASVDDGMKESGFWFGYFIVPPYQNREGIQGIIYLKKKDNRYKIDGIDSIP